MQVQEDIATTVADELKVTLGAGKSFRQLGGTNNEEAYEFYLVAKGTLSSAGGLATTESVEAALTLDPEFAAAWALKARILAAGLMVSPSSRIDLLKDEALYSAQRAIDLEPNLAEAYASWGQMNTTKGDWIEAELAYRKAVELTKDPSLEYRAAFFMQYLSVANFERAYELLDAAGRNDPFNQSERANYILCLGLLGEKQRAETEEERTRELFRSQWTGDMLLAFSQIVSGDVTFRDEVKKWFWPSDNESWNRIESHEDGIAELHKFYADNKNPTLANLLSFSICAAYFGDPDLAMDSMEKALHFDFANTYIFWGPVMHEVRQLPRFKKFVREIGLVDYWEKFGWPDICRPLDNGDFECD